jgi:glycosyltransferase involved in cell wall biosynthesis
MQVLFVHPNFPAQFGPILSRLRGRPDVRCVFASKNASGVRDGVRCIRFDVKGGATRATHYCSRTFENATWNAWGVYEACKAAADLKPDLIVGHSGFGTTIFLRELYDCPVVNHIEYFYRPHGSDLDFRPDFPPLPINFLRSRTRNAMILLDLEASAAAYTPTQWQWSLLPEVWRPKVEVIHDGIDTDAWRRRAVPRRVGTETIDDGTRIVTYVSRGLEAMRGFDVFVRVANRIAAEMPNVVFIVVGSDRVHYGDDLRHTGAKSFREHVLATEKPDLRRFRFLGTLPAAQLADLFSISDLHVYLTVPFVLSWSLLNAMACECTVLGSDTAPVREVIKHGKTGLLADFFDADALATEALRALRDPAVYRALGSAAREEVEARFGLDRTFPRVWDLFTRVLTSPASA